MLPGSARSDLVLQKLPTPVGQDARLEAEPPARHSQAEPGIERSKFLSHGRQKNSNSFANDYSGDDNSFLFFHPGLEFPALCFLDRDSQPHF